MNEKDCIGEECTHAKILCADCNCEGMSKCPESRGKSLQEARSDCSGFVPELVCEHLMDGNCDLPEDER